MKKLLILLLIILPLQKSFSQSKYLTAYKPYFDSLLKDWSNSYSHFQLSSFQISDTLDFENIPFGNINNLKEFYDLYKPALAFSPDSSKFIDLYGYRLNLGREGNKLIANEEVDGAVSLCNLKTKSWIRIYFLGVSSGIDEAEWISNRKFILVGYSNYDEDGKFRPMILIGDTNKEKLFLYEDLDKSTIAKKSGYTPSGIKKLNFEDD